MRFRIVKKLINYMHNQGFLWDITGKYKRIEVDGYFKELKFFVMTSDGMLKKIESIEFKFI